MLPVTLAALPHSQPVQLALLIVAGVLVSFSWMTGGLTRRRDAWGPLKGLSRADRQRIHRLAIRGECVRDATDSPIVRTHAIGWSHAFDSRSHHLSIAALALSLLVMFGYTAAVNASLGHWGRALVGATFLLGCVALWLYSRSVVRQVRRTVAVNGW